LPGVVILKTVPQPKPQLLLVGPETVVPKKFPSVPCTSPAEGLLPSAQFARAQKLWSVVSLPAAVILKTVPHPELKRQLRLTVPPATVVP
jgi:hypothetical protein